MDEVDHDVGELHRQLYARWHFLHEVAGKELHHKRLAHLDPIPIVDRMIDTMEKKVEAGELDVSKVESWEALCTTYIHNVIRNAGRRSWRLIFTAHADEPVAQQPVDDEALEDALERLDRWQTLELLAMLPHPVRSVLTLHLLDGIPIPEVAALNGLDRDEVQRQVHSLRSRVGRVADGAVLRGPDREVITAFARSALAWRDRRRGHG